MADELIAVSRDEVVQALSIGLRVRKGNATVGDFMATVTADFIVDRLLSSNYVVMRKPPGPRHSTW